MLLLSLAFAGPYDADLRAAQQAAEAGSDEQVQELLTALQQKVRSAEAVSGVTYETRATLARTECILEEPSCLESLAALTQAFPSEGGAWVMRSRVEAPDDESRQVEILLEGSRKAPDSAVLHHVLGVKLWKADRNEEALPVLKKGAALEDSRGFNCLELAVQVATRLGRRDEADALVEQVREHTPGKIFVRETDSEWLARQSETPIGPRWVFIPRKSGTLYHVFSSETANDAVAAHLPKHDSPQWVLYDATHERLVGAVDATWDYWRLRDWVREQVPLD